MAQHSNIQGNLRPTGLILTQKEHTHISVCHMGTRLLLETRSVGFIIILFLFYYYLFIIVLFCFFLPYRD